jgi:hypothetical protein
MQNTTSSPAHRRELNTLAWVVFVGALIALTGVFFYLKNRSTIQSLMAKSKA